MASVGYVLDSKKRLYELHFLSDGQIKMFNFGCKTSEISTFSSYNKVPGWIRENLDSAEAMKLVHNFKKH